MQDLLFGSWGASGAKLVACGQQRPFAVFAAVLAAILVPNLMFANHRSSGDGGIGGWWMAVRRRYGRAFANRFVEQGLTCQTAVLQIFRRKVLGVY
jgi:hypothetical protein